LFDKTVGTNPHKHTITVPKLHWLARRYAPGLSESILIIRGVETLGCHVAAGAIKFKNAIGMGQSRTVLLGHFDRIHLLNGPLYVFQLSLAKRFDHEQ
jgi:hypothetical protein